jgi:hypothetical protein
VKDRIERRRERFDSLGRVRVTRFAARPLLQIAVLFDEYLDEVHLPCFR